MSLIPEPLKITEKGLHPDVEDAHALDLLGLTPLATDDDSFYLFGIQGTWLDLAKGQPSLIPTLVPNYGVYVGLLHELTR